MRCIPAGFAFVFGMIVGMFLGGCVTKNAVTDTCQKAAVKHGAAEWVITDPVTGKTEFKWREQNR